MRKFLSNLMAKLVCVAVVAGVVALAGGPVVVSAVVAFVLFSGE